MTTSAPRHTAYGNPGTQQPSCPDDDLGSTAYSVRQSRHTADYFSSTAYSNNSRPADDYSSTAYDFSSTAYSRPFSSTAYSNTGCPADDFSSTAYSRSLQLHSIQQ